MEKGETFGLIVPDPKTVRIQECHIINGHIWCGVVDAAFTHKITDQGKLTLKVNGISLPTAS